MYSIYVKRLDHSKVYLGESFFESDFEEIIIKLDQLTNWFGYLYFGDKIWLKMPNIETM